MGTKRIERTAGNSTSKVPTAKAQKSEPRSRAIAGRGIFTAQDLLDVMTTVVADVLEERVSTQQSNAVANMAGKILKTVEMRFKYGQPNGPMKDKELVLSAALTS